MVPRDRIELPTPAFSGQAENEQDPYIMNETKSKK
jgi:hypothetical protein